MSEAADSPTLPEIRAAAARIASLALRTPVLTNPSLDEKAGASLFFKCENLQRTGSFKIRGAGNAILSMPESDLHRGVVTHSSGNHAAAVACAARHRGVPAYIVVPNNTPQIKRDSVSSYGGRIHLCEPTLPARQAAVDEIQHRTGAVMVHPYDNPAVIAGQGTAALELLEETQELDVIAAPVSGGGLLSGAAIAAHGIKPGMAVFGAEPELADDARRSFVAGRLEPLLTADTIADGLRAALCARTFAILRAHAEDILTVSEEQIIDAMKLLWRDLKVVVEPSGAVALAMVLAHPSRFAGQRVGLILSGGNLDLDRLPWQP